MDIPLLASHLSKAWKLIQRFSEDIDLIVDKEVLGFGGDDAPDKAPAK
ncbi:MAG: nucleotidyl transferase AbiEii/AbiGii toxin family protein [Luteolibacter sp.]